MTLYASGELARRTTDPLDEFGLLGDGAAGGEEPAVAEHTLHHVAAAHPLHEQLGALGELLKRRRTHRSAEGVRYDQRVKLLRRCTDLIAQ